MTLWNAPAKCKGLAHMRVAICAGHSDASPGVVVNGDTEQSMCRQIVDRAVKEALRHGWEVIDPHSDEMGFSYPEYLVDRIETLQHGCVDIAIDLHLNASYDRTINHSLVVYGDGRVESRLCAEAIANELVRELPWPSRGAVSDANLGRKLAFVRKLSCPAVIIEPLFLSNATAQRWLHEDGHRESLAEMIVRGVEAWSRAQVPQLVALGGNR